VTGPARHYSPADRAESIYQYVPFEVPASAAGVTVSFAYDRSLAIIDLGLAGPDRFVGWSGGERAAVTVARDWATPGYLPGVAPGTWQVIFGLHRIFVASVSVSIDVEVHRTAPIEPPAPARPPRRERPPRRSLPASPGREWLACDFHSHTVHSDGGLTVDELAALAVERGLDVVAVTDHNTTSHHRFLPDAGAHAGVVLVPGQEVTTDRGHANVFGDVSWIDFRRPAREWQAEARQRGGLFSVNHPWAGDCAWRQSLDSPADFVELWHSTWDRLSSEPLEGWRTFGQLPIGGSDFHRPTPSVTLAEPTTWVESEDRSVDAVLAAMAEGRVAISASPTAPLVLRVDGALVTVDAEDSEIRSTDQGAAVLRHGTTVMSVCHDNRLTPGMMGPNQHRTSSLPPPRGRGRRER